MFNLVGILLALLISENSRGQGVLVGWESVLAAVVATAATTAFLYSCAAQVAGRLEWLRLQARAALDSSEAMAASASVDRELMARRVPIFRLAADGGLLLMYFALTHLFGWVDYVGQVWGVPQRLDLLPNLLPYFAMLAGSWLAQVRLENALHGPAWRPGAYLAFQARANLMTILPVAVIQALYWGVLHGLPVVSEIRDAFKYSDFVLTFALVLPVFAFMPVAVRFALPTRKLEDGPLRRSLEGFARRRGLGLGGIYVWQTGSRHFATAFVIGLFGPLRYVFITDAMLRRFNEAEIQAVFAHEMGHVRHRHLWWLLAFLVSFSVLMLAVEEAVLKYFMGGAWLLLAAMLMYGYAAFGYLSRRFERQADDFAARETSPELMASVLLKLGMSNPAAMTRRGWRHFPIRQRVEEIALQAQQPQARALFDTERRRGMLAVAAVTLGAVALLSQPVREDYVSGLATFALARFDRARIENAPPQRIEQLRERVLRHSAAMAQLDDEYAMAALWYEGVVEGLSGHESKALQELAARARSQRAEAQDDEARNRAQFWINTAQATPAAITRAQREGSPWLQEVHAEMARRGHQP